MTYLFLDTNVLLHYRRIEEIDWLSLSGSTDVVIVLCPAVIRELDHLKVGHPQKKFRKRAQEIVAMLHRRLNASSDEPIREKIRFEFMVADPVLDFAEQKLRPELPDDWLIASSIAWKTDHPNDEIKIVTADLGVSLKAKTKAIPTLFPLETDKIVDEIDADEKRILQLQKELAEARNCQPRLTLCFYGETPAAKFLKIQLSSPSAFDAKRASETMDRIRLEYELLPPPDRFGRIKLSERQIRRNQLSGWPLQSISKWDAERYNSELQRFYQDYEAYLRVVHDQENQQRLNATLEIGLENDGAAPAEDIDVHLHFPDGFKLFNSDEFVPKQPKAPEAPVVPGTFNFATAFKVPALHNLALTPQTIRGISPPSNVSSPTIKRTNSYDVRSHITKAKHGYVLQLATLVVVFDTYESAGSFTIRYYLSAANLPKAAQGELSVAVEKV